MLKILIVSIVVMASALAVYLNQTRPAVQNEKVAEAKEAISTLGHFAENHVKTAENMATFRSVFGDDKKDASSTESKQQGE